MNTENEKEELTAQNVPKGVNYQIKSVNLINKNIQIIPTDPDRDTINDNFNATTGCLIHSHTLLLQNKIVIARQNKIVITQQNKIVTALRNKIVIVRHWKMQVIDNRI